MLHSLARLFDEIYHTEVFIRYDDVQYTKRNWPAGSSALCRTQLFFRLRS